jgi:hypothetical protein
MLMWISQLGKENEMKIRFDDTDQLNSIKGEYQITRPIQHQVLTDINTIKLKLLKQRLNFSNQKKAELLLRLLENSVYIASVEINILKRKIQKMEASKNEAQ